MAAEAGGEDGAQPVGTVGELLGVEDGGERGDAGDEPEPGESGAGEGHAARGGGAVRGGVEGGEGGGLGFVPPLTVSRERPLEILQPVSL